MIRHSTRETKKDIILRMKAEGKTYREIQEEARCSLSTIAFHCGEGQKEKSANRQRIRRLDKNVINNKNLYQRYANCFITGKKNKKKRLRNPRTFTFKEFEDLVNNTSACYITGKKINTDNFDEWEVDHTIPTSRGGKMTLNNIKIVSKVGNRIKSDLDYMELVNLCKEIIQYSKSGMEVTQTLCSSDLQSV